MTQYDSPLRYYQTSVWNRRFVMLSRCEVLLCIRKVYDLVALRYEADLRISIQKVLVHCRGNRKKLSKCICMVMCL